MNRRSFRTLAPVASLAGCRKSPDGPGVFVACRSVGDVFSRPVWKQFQKQTSIGVKLVADTGQTMNTGVRFTPEAQI
jgi:hypothetical protein